MRLNISLPKDLLQQIDETAKARHVSLFSRWRQPVKWPSIMNESERTDAHVQAWRDEIRRQIQLVNEADKNAPWIQRFMEENLNDTEGWK